MEQLNEWVCGRILPFLLLGAGCIFGIRLRFFWLLHPFRTLRILLSARDGASTSPFAALTVALAGTLGVGNIVGVATAITAGGAGAVFWMLAGALASMGIKYAEIYLAIHFRRSRTEKGIRRYYGGAMYSLRDGIGGKQGAVIGGGFALLCAINALLTGTIVQVNAAVQCVSLPPLCFGILFAGATVLVTARGSQRIAAVTSIGLPILAGGYLLISLTVLVAHCSELPRIASQIITEAWGFQPIGGGAAGIGISHAIRFGITRGIFSNEAGCGTAPTAHAMADTKSAHHQGIFGILEVFVDTVVLCTVTAFVILLSPKTSNLDGIPLVLAAYGDAAAAVFGHVAGEFVRVFLRISVILFAFATVISQSCCGMEALRYFPMRYTRFGFYLCSLTSIFIGTQMRSVFLWSIADLVIALMTLINTTALLFLWSRKYCADARNMV